MNTTGPTSIILAHLPSLTDKDELEIIGRIWETEDPETAGFALRTCDCGKRIDGFYQYVEHLISKLEETDGS